MDKKILSFEEYAANKGLATTEVAETEEESTIEESCESCGEDPCTCESEEIDDESDDEESDDEESDDEESDDEESDDEESDDDDILESCSEQLKKCYEGVIKEACAYDGDDYPDHTLESYLKENAALVAALTAESMEQAHAEIKDDDMTIETYEAMLNTVKESYNKKIEELKEGWSAK